jgi:hypothetical protein
MVHIPFVCLVLLAGTAASAAQEPRPDGDPKVLIQLGSIYGNAENDAEFARHLHVLASECGNEKDRLRRMQFAYDAIEVSKLMEPKSCYVTVLEFSKSLPKETAEDAKDIKAFRSLILFELWRLAFQEYCSSFGLDQIAVERLFGVQLVQPAGAIRRIQTGESASGLQFDLSHFGILARAALDSCSNEQDRFDTYWELKQIGLFAPKGGFCYGCYEDQGFGVFPAVLARPFDTEIYLPYPKQGGGRVKERWDQGKITQDQETFRNLATLRYTDGGQQVAIRDLQQRLDKMESRVETLVTTVAAHEHRIQQCEQRDEQIERRLNELAELLTRPRPKKRKFWKAAGEMVAGMGEGIAGVVKTTSTTAVRALGDAAQYAVRQLVEAGHEPAVKHLEKLAESATPEAKRIAVVFDFDTDSAYPSPAISKTGEINGGLKATGGITGDCRSPDQLDNSNAYYRKASITKNGVEYSVHMYALYFMKDQWAHVNPFSFVGQAGHRHDWEYALVWTKDGKITHASCSAHGELTTRAKDELHFDEGKGDAVKVVYHKDHVATHSFRFADPGERAENDQREFLTPTIVDWLTMEGRGVGNAKLREMLNTSGFGEAVCPVNDNNFGKEIAKNPPAEYPLPAEWRAASKPM